MWCRRKLVEGFAADVACGASTEVVSSDAANGQETHMKSLTMVLV